MWESEGSQCDCPDPDSRLAESFLSGLRLVSLRGRCLLLGGGLRAGLGRPLRGLGASASSSPAACRLSLPAAVRRHGFGGRLLLGGSSAAASAPSAAGGAAGGGGGGCVSACVLRFGRRSLASRLDLQQQLASRRARTGCGRFRRPTGAAASRPRRPCSWGRSRSRPGTVPLGASASEITPTMCIAIKQAVIHRNRMPAQRRLRDVGDDERRAAVELFQLLDRLRRCSAS